MYLYNINILILNTMMKLIWLVLACFLLQVSGSSPSSGDIFDTCFYKSLGRIYTDPRFRYNITNPWTPEETPKVKKESSNFITVNGWSQYVDPFDFFKQLCHQPTKQFHRVSDSFKPDVKKDSSLSLEQNKLLFAFGDIKNAVLYTVPTGKAIITIRFQVAVDNKPHLGQWSALVDLVDERDIKQALEWNSKNISSLIIKHKLTGLEVTQAFNIIPQFTAGSLFYTFKASPALGRIASIQYDAFLFVIRAGERFLAGPINQGQPDVTQIYDNVNKRQECVEEKRQESVNVNKDSGNIQSVKQGQDSGNKLGVKQKQDSGNIQGGKQKQDSGNIQGGERVQKTQL